MELGFALADLKRNFHDGIKTRDILSGIVASRVENEAV